MEYANIQNSENDVCEACGAAVPGGRTGCETLFHEVIAREFGDYRYGRIHRLTVDAYSLQAMGEGYAALYEDLLGG